MSATSNNSSQADGLLRQVRAASEAPAPVLMRERIEELFLVCRDAAELEELQLRSGKHAPPPAPWPDSTWEFLRREARKHHE